MNPTQLMAIAMMELRNAMPHALRENNIKEVEDDITGFAVAAAVAGGAANLIPGAGGVIAAFSQAGLVWAMYVKINNSLGIKISNNVLKFIGSAVITNLAAGAGTLLLGYAAAGVLSFIPVVGQMSAALLDACLGFVLMYVSALIYLKLITKMVDVNGNINVSESEETKAAVKDIVKDTDIEAAIKEGKNEFKKAKANGDIDRAKENPTCPGCGAKISKGQKFCSVCGTPLTLN